MTGLFFIHLNSKKSRFQLKILLWRWPLARVTIEDCLDKVPNRFILVHMAARRVRQIREGSEYLIESSKNEDIVVALREIAAGKVHITDPEKYSSEND